MNNVKQSFSIKDLENLSGIKAHTIRIWEKRYALLSPQRSDTNIRNYDLGSLQKLLNITLLYNNGYKISKIAKVPEKEIPLKVREIMAKNSTKHHAINAFKLAMINFDQSMFLTTYDALLQKKSFREIFKEIFVPLLNELGLLWQTDTISPAHEHFITGLIKQKIYNNTEKLQLIAPTRSDKSFVLFLPENEIHEIGLLYLNYEVTLRGYKSVYLGQTVPMDSLQDLLKYFDNLHFLSYFTVQPSKDRIHRYLSDFDAMVRLGTKASKLWVLGHQVQYISTEKITSQVKIFNSIEQVIEQL